MNKLFKLKKWLTLDEAARRLSSSAEEPISVADVLRLALDGELVLSVDFVNHARAQPWVKTPRGRARTLTYDPKLMGLEGEPEEIFSGFAVNQDEVLQSLGVDAPVRLHGVYDLTMWGSEALDVENMYQELTDGPPVELMNIEGAFVKGENDVYYQILESYEDNGYMQGSRAHLKNLESRILLQALGAEEAKGLRERYMESRVSFLESASKKRAIDNYYPASGLPVSCRLVVRNESIRSLEDRLLAEPFSGEPDSADNVKPSHFLAISALLELLKEPVKHPRPNGLNQAAVIESILARFEFRGLGKRTLEEIFSVSNKAMKSSA